MAGNANSGRRGLTPDQIRSICERIVGLIEAGNFVETAITAAGGISTREAKKWLARGRDLVDSRSEPENDNEAVCLWFAQQVDKSIASFEASAVNKILRAGDDDWKPIAWLLERKMPKKWGQKINVSVKEELDAFLDKLEARLPEETYEAVLRAASEDEFEGETESASEQAHGGHETH